MNFERGSVNKPFSHIYIETSVLNHECTEKICSFFPHASIVEIDDYRDVFDRKKQSHAIQKRSQNLILARKKKDFFYPASPVCQSFDNRYFYYSSSIMNCIYDCEYCFLKGMYPSANIVVFVNLEDFFSSIEETLQKHPMYLCVSYDTDMLALEPILHYAKEWSAFTVNHEDLSIEIRTKGTFNSEWKELDISERIILACTVSPQFVIDHYEHGAPNLDARIQMIKEALSLGCPVRLCFDPIVVFPDWKQEYEMMLQKIHDVIDLSKVKDISLGTFRISKNYLQQMRKQYPESAIIQYPYVCKNGFYQLEDHLLKDVEETVLEKLKQYVDEEKIFRWE